MSRFVPSQRVISGLLIFLSLSALYLYALPQTNLIYPIIVLLHALAGVVAVGSLFVWLWRRLRNETFFGRVGWTLIVAGGFLGLVLIKTGTPRAEWNWLYSHILISSAGVAILLAEWAGKRGWLGSGEPGPRSEPRSFLRRLQRKRHRPRVLPRRHARELHAEEECHDQPNTLKH